MLVIHMHHYTAQGLDFYLKMKFPWITAFSCLFSVLVYSS